MTEQLLILIQMTNCRMLCENCDNAVCRLSDKRCKLHRDICTDKCYECLKSCCIPEKECYEQLSNELAFLSFLIKLNIVDLKENFQQEHGKRGFTSDQRLMIRTIRNGYSKARTIAKILSEMDADKAISTLALRDPIDISDESKFMVLIPEPETEFENYINEQRVLRYSSGRKKEKVSE